jgi:hypothetical protein
LKQGSALTKPTITIAPPTPHSKKQALIMGAFMIPGLREIYIAAGTKFGKTLAAATAQASLAVSRRQSKHRWVAPIYEQAKIGLDDYFPRLLPPAPHSDFRPGKMLITLPELETSIEFWHAKDPMSLEGKAINSYVIDEAAKCPHQTYISARTTTTRTEGPMMIASTPLGKNWFYTACMEAKEHQEWAFRKGVTPEKIFITARTQDNPTINPAVIETARRELPDRLFRQFYMAEFMDDGSVFAGTRECLYGPEIDAYGERQRWFLEGCKEKTVVIGVDWAKTFDYCVFIAIDIETRQVCAFERFHKLPYTEAIRRLHLFAQKFGTIEIILHDKTGVGGAIDDALANLPYAYRGVNFSNQSKGDMVARLITAVEQQEIHLPRWPALISEMDTYEVKTTSAGALTYNAAGGKHDDIVSALMLAHSGLLKYGDRTIEVFFLEDLGRVDKEKAKPAADLDSLEGFYSSLVEDDDDDDN